MWTTHLSNPESLKSIFGTLPDLTEVELMEIILGREGEQVDLRFNIKPFPQNYPPKWEGFNTVQLTISLGPVKNLHITNWQYPINGTLTIDTNKNLNFQSPGCNFICQSSFIQIQNITAYCDERIK